MISGGFGTLPTDISLNDLINMLMENVSLIGQSFSVKLSPSAFSICCFRWLKTHLIPDVMVLILTGYMTVFQGLTQPLNWMWVEETMYLCSSECGCCALFRKLSSCFNFKLVSSFDEDGQLARGLQWEVILLLCVWEKYVNYIFGLIFLNRHFYRRLARNSARMSHSCSMQISAIPQNSPLLKCLLLH